MVASPVNCPHRLGDCIQEEEEKAKLGLWNVDDYKLIRAIVVIVFLLPPTYWLPLLIRPQYFTFRHSSIFSIYAIVSSASQNLYSSNQAWDLIDCPLHRKDPAAAATACEQ